MRRSPVPRTPVPLPAAEAGGASLRRITARAAAALLVLAAVTGCMRVGEPEAPRPSPSAGGPNGGAVMDGAPPVSAGGMGGAPRGSGRSDEDAEETAGGKNGDESPGPSTAPSRKPSANPGTSPGGGEPSPSEDTTQPGSPAPSASASSSGSASPAPEEDPGDEARRRVP